jgi:hypothetical protein
VQAEDDSGLSLLIDDDAGKLIRLPFKVSDGTLKYESPTLVQPPQQALAAGGDFKGPRILASFPQPSKPAVTPRQEAKMKLDGLEVDPAALRARLGLAGDADEAAIKAALTTPATATPPAPAAPAPVAASATVPDGMVMIDADTLEQVKAGAAAGQQVAATLGQQRRDQTITAAIKAGKFAAGRREHYEKAWEADAEGTQKLLTAKVEEGGLAPVIPVGQIEAGRAGDGDADPTAEQASHDAYMARNFPQVHARLRGDRNGRVRVGAEG